MQRQTNSHVWANDFPTWLPPRRILILFGSDSHANWGGVNRANSNGRISALCLAADTARARCDKFTGYPFLVRVARFFVAGFFRVAFRLGGGGSNFTTRPPRIASTVLAIESWSTGGRSKIAPVINSTN